MLTKTEIFRIIGEVTGVSHKDVKKVFETYANLLNSELKSEGEFKLPDIGKFKIVITRERLSRNPTTGQQIKIPPRAKVKFVPIKNIKETVAKVKWEYVKD